MSVMLTWWRGMLRRRPVLTNTVVYGTFYTAAELSQQTFNKYYTPEKPEIDLLAASRIVTVGSGLYAPTLYFWYKFLDHKFVGTAIRTVATKVAMDQLCMTPILLAAFFTVLSVMERKKDVFQELKQKYWTAFVANQSFWIPGQTINFLLVPPHLRVVISRDKPACGPLESRRSPPTIDIRNSRDFSYLDSFDVFWCLEDDSANNIISVLGIVECESPKSLAGNIRDKLETIMANEDTETKKIFYRRDEKFGFYYWRRFGAVDLGRYVRVMSYTKNCELRKSDLENLMVSLTDKPLPYEDEGLFEILIIENKLAHENGKLNDEYGIIFRIHHSVGDGLALVEFLSKSLADKTSDSVIRVPDKNILHGPKLSGKKFYKWTESDENLFMKIKEIKNVFDGAKFSDVLVNTLSYSLGKFFEKIMNTVPEEVGVILPLKVLKSHKLDNFPLKNDFAVTIMDVPIKHCNINVARRTCNKIRTSADPMTNYYLLKALCSVLPKGVLQRLLNSNQATLVFSNMPGPERLSVCGGNVLKSLIFFVPYKGSTGVGVTALTYGNELRFGIVADAVLLSNAEDLECILLGMVEGINELHKKHVR
ncbi:Mpv17-like protein [Eumeta japonica]|uniref:Mpv17-like protein n=1 Tax=Eumeta variegata TaxID=151549 RepID=A0A4C1WVW2_EUMVA|nr:Mpv17-like protein [Eumeta japonica]